MLPDVPIIDDKEKFGKLITPDIKIFRNLFNEFVMLYGIQVIYYAPLDDKTYDLHGVVLSNYSAPCKVGCIFDEYPDQKSMRKKGWVVELQEGASIISVPYDLKGIQKGALFAIPSGIEGAPSRFFRVESLLNVMIYPSSISCEVVPEWSNTLPDTKLNLQYSDFNLVAQEDPNVF